MWKYICHFAPVLIVCDAFGQMGADMRKEVLRVRELSAGFVRGYGLQQIGMNLYEGEVLGVLELHEAWKTFFFDCLTGKAKAATGKVFLFEEQMGSGNLKGENIIYRMQEESALVSLCSVLENILVIRKQRRRKFFVPWKSLRQQAEIFMREFGIDMNPDQVVTELSLPERHILEILKAYITGAKLILIDDIFIPYSNDEYDQLYSIIKRFSEKGISFMICGSQLEKLQRLTDRCLFMIDGTAVKTIDHIRRKQMDDIKLFIRSREGSYRDGLTHRKKSKRNGEEKKRAVFEARDVVLETGEQLNFSIYEGEIIVFVDFFRQWVLEMMAAIEGRQLHSGNFVVNGKIMKKGCEEVYISDFLERNYLYDNLSLGENLSLPIYRRIAGLGFLSKAKVQTIEKLFLKQYENKGGRNDFSGEHFTFYEKMAIYLERIKLQKWSMMFCTNMENVMSYEVEELVKEQLSDMTLKRAVGICSSSFEKYMDLADYFLFMTDQKCIEKFTYAELCEYLET